MSPLLIAVLLSTAVEIPNTTASTLHHPAAKGPHPAILLVEGWWQPGDWEQEAAQRLASEGYLVLTVQPDRGPTSPDMTVMHAAMAAPPSARNRAGLDAARNWLLKRSDVAGRRIGVVGARMGGRDALQMAGDAGVAAVVSWYGVPPAAAHPQTAVLAFFGGKDFGPSLADAERFRAAAKGTATEVQIYPEAQHGFAHPGNAWGGFEETAARDSWTRALAFLDARLRRP